MMNLQKWKLHDGLVFVQLITCISSLTYSSVLNCTCENLNQSCALAYLTCSLPLNSIPYVHLPSPVLLEIPCHKDVSLFPPQITLFEAIFSPVPVTLYIFYLMTIQSQKWDFYTISEKLQNFPLSIDTQCLFSHLRDHKILDLKIYIPL